MTGLTDERRPTRSTAWAVLWLAAALGCTRLNPAFGTNPPEAGTPDAEEPPADAGAPPDRSSPQPLPGDADVGDLMVPDGMQVSPDAAADPHPDAASDPRPPAPSADAAPPAVADTDLVAYWPLDEGEGNSLINDRSGNGNTGSLAVVDPSNAWKAGHAGSSVEIPDAIGAGVVVKASASLDRVRTAFTISAWVYRLISIKNRNWTVLSRQVGTSSREIYSLAFQNDSLVLWLYAASPASEVNLRASNRTAPLNDWIHVAATWDGQMVRLYQSGAEVGRLSYAGPLGATDKPVILGNNANSTGIDQPLGGRLDDVRLYDRALSAAEISALAR